MDNMCGLWEEAEIAKENPQSKNEHSNSTHKNLCKINHFVAVTARYLICDGDNIKQQVIE